MIDAYAHLDMSVAHPIDDLAQRMRSAGVVRALIVETWSGDNRECLHQLMAQASAASLTAPCFRPEQAESGAETVSSDVVRAIRVKTADLERLDGVSGILQSREKWLLCHAESGIAALTQELLQLASVYPELRIYVPHMGWPRRDKQDDADWAESMRALARLPHLIMGVSAIEHFSRLPFPHEDIDPFVADLLEAFGPDRLVCASDYPLFEKERYTQYIHRIAGWTGGIDQAASRAASSLLGDLSSGLKG